VLFAGSAAHTAHGIQSKARTAETAHLKAVQEIVGLLEEVEGVDEEDGHAAVFQVAQAVQQVQNDHITSYERTRECRPLKGLHCCLYGAQRALL